ncbi:hypothetical protein F7018_16705 [Tenacibaculum aiptasiae]|uniref:Uncharacterized protein n=1 Tax=Tenacibaculum aiptasiae TaxID=426481 RepID=A0A7J5A7C4_9FLAO|nr:hypothetical protein [Tenacibaculum aiptasiae]KAB1153472.1 hypothetical protein F7018_16705 [Tenacibaculum aiptasiae]
MIIKKEIIDHEFYLWFNGKLVFKKWLDQGSSKVFDYHAWGKYTEYSITDFDLEETPPLYHVECKLTLYTEEEGGRVSAIRNGYRPNNVFEYESDGNFKYAFVGDFQFGENNLIEPGKTQNVLARFLTSQPIEQYLHIGQKWWLHEDINKIGEAEVIKVELPKEK